MCNFQFNFYKISRRSRPSQPQGIIPAQAGFARVKFFFHFCPTRPMRPTESTEFRTSRTSRISSLRGYFLRKQAFRRALLATFWDLKFFFRFCPIKRCKWFTWFNRNYELLTMNSLLFPLPSLLLLLFPLFDKFFLQSVPLVPFLTIKS